MADVLIGWLCILAAIIVPVVARAARVREQHRTLFLTSRPTSGRYTGRTDS